MAGRQEPLPRLCRKPIGSVSACGSMEAGSGTLCTSNERSSQRHQHVSTCSHCIVISATDDHMSIPKKHSCASDLASPLASSCSCSSSSSSSNRWKVHCMRNTIDSISRCKDLQPCQAHLVILCLFNCFSAEHFFRYISLVQRFLQNMFWCSTPVALPFKVERTFSLLNLKIIQKNTKM